MTTNDHERIGKYFSSIGAFGVNEADPVGTLLAYAEEWRTNWLNAQAEATKLKKLQDFYDMRSTALIMLLDIPDARTIGDVVEAVKKLKSNV